MRHELLTILFIRSSYKIRKINLPFLYYQLLKFLVIVFFAAFIGLTVLTWYLFSNNSDLKKQVLYLKNQQKNAFLNGNSSQSKTRPTKDSGTTRPVMSESLVLDNIDAHIVNIRNLNISIENEQLLTKFDLVNITEPNQQVDGFLNIIFLKDFVKNSKALGFPQNVEFDKDFNIVDFKKGDSFSIKYFKKVNIQLGSPNFDICYAIVRVFSSDGQVIYQTVKSVDNDK